MPRACEGKIALIVGGTRGIGRAAALALAQAGATVIPTGRSLASVQEIASELTKFGAESLPLAFDVADSDASAAAVNEVVRRFGRIDVMVGNAGISPHWKRAEHLTPAMWDEVMAVNLRGMFFCMQAAGRHMLSQRNGSIVVLSSVTASVGVVRGLPYTATKGGLDAIVRSLAIEWADRNVRVNGVAPGYVATDLTHGVRDNAGLSSSLLESIPMGRFAEPEEVAGMIAYLASDTSSYVTGQIFVVDGGFAAGKTSPPRERSVQMNMLPSQCVAKGDT
jgi:NAD(P)-dependent dehydrogenase (short-subunit alcohol dehydrogenase family)